MSDTTPGLLIRAAEISGRPERDCRIRHGRIAELGDALQPCPHDLVLQARGGALIPGLADHHIHLAALAAWRESHDITDIPPAALASTLRSARTDTGGWIRAVGYDEATHGDLDRDLLDAWSPRIPLRVQHRSGALWVVNSAGLALLAADMAIHPGIERDATGRATGRIWRADDWLRERLPSAPPSLRGIGHELASSGITHVSDATPDDDGSGARLLIEAVESGDIPQHTATMSAKPPALDHPRLTVGPVKLIVADHQLPALDDLVERIRTAHTGDRAVAVHCVSREALALTLAALDQAGTREGDRIEHCAVADLAMAAELARRRIRVVTQPTLIARRGDTYWERVEAADRPDLWRYATLRNAGITVAPSSDAPYGDPNPWTCLRGASSRLTPSGRTLGPEERVPPDVALAGMQSDLADPGGRPRTIHPGAPADLVLLDRPLSIAMQDLDIRSVAATIIDGTLAYRATATG